MGSWSGSNSLQDKCHNGLEQKTLGTNKLNIKAAEPLLYPLPLPAGVTGYVFLDFMTDLAPIKVLDAILVGVVDLFFKMGILSPAEAFPPSLRQTHA